MHASLVLNIAQYCRGKDDPVTWYDGTKWKYRYSFSRVFCV